MISIFELLRILKTTTYFFLSLLLSKNFLLYYCSKRGSWLLPFQLIKKYFTKNKYKSKIKSECS